ncbi:MAG: LysR family transcriptional regulator [Clostridiaceae bacterium]
MDILQLKYFQTVAKFQHMTHAADELCIAQPSLSKTISRLEQELGVPLFDRQGRNIKLNSFGKAFLKRVNRIFLEIDEGKKELSDMAGLEQGKIVLASISLASFPNMLGGFVEQYPDVSFRQVLAYTYEMKRNLEEGVIDLCISSIIIEGSNIVNIPLLTEEIFLAVPKNHRLANRESIDLIEVADEHFISMKRGYGLRDITDEYCRRVGFTPSIMFESDGVTSLLSLVNSGLGVSFLPSPDKRVYTSEVPKLIKIKNPTPTRTIYLSYIEGRYLSQAAREFCKYTIDYFNNVVE